jgi:hypothetical protein
MEVDTANSSKLAAVIFEKVKVIEVPTKDEQ